MSVVKESLVKLNEGCGLHRVERVKTLEAPGRIKEWGATTLFSSERKRDKRANRR
jgi:hypothetical protein